MAGRTGKTKGSGTGQPPNTGQHPNKDLTTLPNSHNLEPGMMKSPCKEKVCVVSCQYDGDGDTGESIRCCLCSHWFHIDCINLSQDESNGFWSCFQCRTFPENIISLHEKVDSLNKVNKTLETIIQKQQSQIDEILKEKHETSAMLKSMEARLRELSHNLIPDWDSMCSDESQESIESEGELLIGDSLIRDIMATSDDLTIDSMSGAKFVDVKKKLKSINPKKTHFRSITVVCGTNDTTTKKDVTKIKDDFYAMLEVARTRADRVIVASIPPRTDDRADMAKIDTLNNAVREVCQNTATEFINNDNNFMYRDDSIDSSLLSPSDGLHLSPAGVNKLVANLGIENKAKANIGNGPTSRWYHKKHFKCTSSKQG